MSASTFPADVPDLRGRSFLKELDHTPAEWAALLDLAARLKAEHHSGQPRQRLRGKAVALLFEKTSTRTRAAFELAAAGQGAASTYLDPTGSHLGHKESVEDTGRVLGRLYDGIEYRGAAQATVELLADVAGVPVWNGLTDEWHPTQSLCDALTMREVCGKPLAETSFAFLGDGRSNVAASLLAMAALVGADARVVAPPALQPPAAVLDAASAVAATTGARLTVTDDVAAGVAGVDAVHTDVWVSLGEPESAWAERVPLLVPYRVDAGVLAATGNPDVRFLHCLPAFHDLGTSLARAVHERYELAEMEVSDEVFRGPASRVLDQAENRRWTIEAVLVATLAGLDA
ncbi:ornithine carbamoyltransferase [Pseudokineococcus sp. 1T1Z-3]|uniref:ornithine carbamoyltransferase n=1 Tax=Pseudokineococcus sp. 1T1Z-3 TaxID=3132745 RepID=UPI0030A8197B